ncbi:hypothetical protein MKW98_004471 [Papaver atlanticum]|uniref:Uncharacterized protein n=1 Tax=Papaver atlanticum TaxID=357466 RepID=A0AAD4SR00_9MAGN|nr:hypothetical protein MKW98_004471 [Papaver atlanticum]
MKQVTELSLIQSVSPNSDEDLSGGNYVIGFASANFTVWNLVNETKIPKESHNRFSYVKEKKASSSLEGLVKLQTFVRVKMKELSLKLHIKALSSHRVLERIQVHHFFEWRE